MLVWDVLHAVKFLSQIEFVESIQQIHWKQFQNLPHSSNWMWLAVHENLCLEMEFPLKQVIHNRNTNFNLSQFSWTLVQWRIYKDNVCLLKKIELTIGRKGKLFPTIPNHICFATLMLFIASRSLSSHKNKTNSTWSNLSKNFQHTKNIHENQDMWHSFTSDLFVFACC